MAIEQVVCGVPFGKSGEKEALRNLKDIGVTSVQIYTFWRMFEPDRRGQFNFESLDRSVRLIREAGLKFVPFLLIGPRYGAPEWWMADPGHVGLRCLEHNKECPIESIWNPAFNREVSRVLQGFADHYLPWNVLESIQPGINGDYGEAIFPALGNWPGTYHTHRGWWCAGEDARASFRQYLADQYQTVDPLNRAWRTRFESFKTIDPFLPQHAPSRTALFDQISWYRDSMTRYSEFWMAECHRIFPKLPIYLCTGGADDEVTTGALFSAQAKISGKHGGGIRLTNEGNKFSYNFPLTTHTHAACDFYGAYLGLEPVGPMTGQGVLSRMFGSAAFGNRQIFHYYHGNLFDGKNQPLPGSAAVKQYTPLLKEQKVESGIAFFWPIDQMSLAGAMTEECRSALLHIRRQYPVSAVNEEMILDGALAKFPCLVMMGAGSTRPAVLKRIACWVREEGGLLLTVKLCRGLELEPVQEFDSLFGITPESEEAWGHHGENIQANGAFPKLGAIPSFHAEVGWLALAEGTERLASAKEGHGGGGVEGLTFVRAVSACFRRTYPGGGQAIFYCGFVRFEQDPETVFKDPGVMPALLDDVCAASGIKPLGTQPDELARARVGVKLLILRDGRIDVQDCP